MAEWGDSAKGGHRSRKVATVIVVFALLSATLIILVGLPRDNGTVVPPEDDVPLSYDQPTVTPYLEWQNLEGRWTGLPPYLNAGLDGNISSVGPETSGNLTDGDVGVNGTYFLTALANLTQGSRDALKGASEDVNISGMFWVVGIEGAGVNASDAWVHYRGTDGDLPISWRQAGDGRMVGIVMNSPLDVSGEKASGLEARMQAWVQFNRTEDYRLSIWVSDVNTLMANDSSVRDFSQLWKEGISPVKETRVHVRPSNYSASPRSVDVLMKDDPVDYSQPIGGDNVTVEAQQAAASMVMALPTTFTISASWRYEAYNSFFGLITHPCKGAFVELWRLNDSGTQTVVETKFTDDSGRVSFDPVIRGKYAVVVSADDTITVQVDRGSQESDPTFKWWTGWKDVASNQAWSMRIGGAERGVWAAYDNVRDEASWMKSQAGWNRSQVEVHWTTKAIGFFASINDIYISRSYPAAIWSRDTLLHEYAHCVMYAAYGDNYIRTGFGGGHTIYTESTEGFAMLEGFAEFMACAVDNDPVYSDGSIGSTTFADGWHGSSDIGDSGDWDGATVEGAVAQVFWDMFDGIDTRDYPSWDPNKYGDSIDRQFALLWKIMVDHHPDSIKEVWDHWSSQNSDLWAIYYHARINMDDSPPANPDQFTSDPPVRTSSSSNDITVSWAGASDDLSGVGGYSYSWSTTAEELPDEKIETTKNSALGKDLVDGRWYLHVRTADRAGNWANSSFSIGPFIVGFPTQPITNNSIGVTWTYPRYDGSNKPCQGAYVELLKNVGGSTEVSATGFTDSEGRVRFDNVGPGSYAAKIWVDDKTAVRVVDNSSAMTTYSWSTEWGDVSGNVEWTYTMPKETLVNSMGQQWVKSDLWEDYDAIRIEYKWVKDHLNWSRSQVALRIPGDGAHSHGDLIDSNIPAGDGQLHEYAHSIMFAMYGDEEPPYRLVLDPKTGYYIHQLDMETYPGTALIEGFAEFLDHAVSGDPIMRNLYGDTSLDSTTYADGPLGNGDYGDWDGNVTEGAVASVFWDIYDGAFANDYPSWDPYHRGDNIDSQLKTLWNIMLMYHPQSIDEIWQHWEPKDTNLWIIFYHARIMETPNMAPGNASLPGTNNTSALPTNQTNVGGGSSANLSIPTRSTSSPRMLLATVERNY